MWKAIDGTFGERQGLEEMVLLLTPILMNALAVHIGLRMKLWNIGSEGQFFMGAWAAAGDRHPLGRAAVRSCWS